MPDDWLDPHSVRKELQSEIYDAVVYAHSLGWRIRRQGHKLRMYCPCAGREGKGFNVPGSSKTPGTQAERIRRSARHCPDKHDLIK